VGSTIWGQKTGIPHHFYAFCCTKEPYQTLTFITVEKARFKQTIKRIVHFEINFIKCFSLPQGHPRCRCHFFHFNFDIFRSNHPCLSVI